MSTWLRSSAAGVIEFPPLGSPSLSRQLCWSHIEIIHAIVIECSYTCLEGGPH